MPLAQTRPRGWWPEMLDTVLHSYSIIFFSQSRWLGVILLLVTFTVPVAGLLGLGGVLIALAAARVLGFDREPLRSGFYLFNVLLVSLGLAKLHHVLRFDPLMLIILLVAASILTLFISAALSCAMARHLSLPSMSLPFVIVLSLLFLLAPLRGMLAATGGADAMLPELGRLPDYLQGYLQSFGAIFFLPYTVVGLLILCALFLQSRLAVLFASVGYAVGVLVLHGLHADTSSAGLAAHGFNFLFCGLAVGGIFLIPSRASVVMTCIASALCALIALSVKMCLAPFGIPAFALPLNLAVLLTLSALYVRTLPRFVKVTAFVPGNPEENFHHYTTEAIRFPHAVHPHLSLPFYGERVVTQGMHGHITHCADWAHALDFELLDAEGQPYALDAYDLMHYFSYLTPVFSPCFGLVVKVVEHIEDNLIGANNLDQNWGNLVIIQMDAGGYVLLCHLAQYSIVVKEGYRVAAGAVIAKCGNSGRSPYPHLHMQVQLSPQIGAPTTPFTLDHYVERTGLRHRYHTSGAPAQGAHIRALVFETSMSSCFDMLGDQPSRYRVRTPAGEYEEEISCHIDATGAYHFHSVAWKASFTARLIDRAWYALDYEGDARSILLYFWLGLGRVPMTLEEGVQWEEPMDVRPLLHAWSRAWFDLCGPFLPYSTIHVVREVQPLARATTPRYPLAQILSEMSWNGANGSVAARMPRRITITIGPHQGIHSARVQLAHGEVEIVRVWETLSPDTLPIPTTNIKGEPL